MSTTPDVLGTGSAPAARVVAEIVMEHVSRSAQRKKGASLHAITMDTYLLARSGVECGDDLIKQRDVELGLGEIEDCLCVLGD